MKTYIDEMLKDIPPRIIDQRAMSTEELIRATGRGRCGIAKTIRTFVQSGRWEMVWKRDGGRLVPAYRKVKHRAS